VDKLEHFVQCWRKLVPVNRLKKVQMQMQIFATCLLRRREALQVLYFLSFAMIQVEGLSLFTDKEVMSKLCHHSSVYMQTSLIIVSIGLNLAFHGCVVKKKKIFVVATYCFEIRYILLFPVHRG